MNLHTEMNHRRGCHKKKISLERNVKSGEAANIRTLLKANPFSLEKENHTKINGDRARLPIVEKLLEVSTSLYVTRERRCQRRRCTRTHSFYKLSIRIILNLSHFLTLLFPFLSQTLCFGCPDNQRKTKNLILTLFKRPSLQLWHLDWVKCAHHLRRFQVRTAKSGEGGKKGEKYKTTDEWLINWNLNQNDNKSIVFGLSFVLKKGLSCCRFQYVSRRRAPFLPTWLCLTRSIEALLMLLVVVPDRANVETGRARFCTTSHRVGSSRVSLTNRHEFLHWYFSCQKNQQTNISKSSSISIERGVQTYSDRLACPWGDHNG